MAVFNGTAVKNSGGNTGSIHAEVTVSHPGTVARVRIRVWWKSTYSAYSSSNSRSFSGTYFPGASGSVGISHGGSGGSTTLYDQTVDVARGYGTGPSGSFSASISGIANFSGTTFSVSGSWSAQPLPYEKPNSATNLKATRVSDTQQTLTWTRNPTTPRPITGHQVFRRNVISQAGSATVWGSWTNISGTISGTATSYTDKSTVANRYYQYDVRTINSAGWAAATSQPEIATTPATPTSATASKNAARDIVVTWAGTWYYPTSALKFTVSHSTNGGASWGAGSGAQASTNRSWTAIAPNASQTHTYCVQAHAGSLWGYLRATGTVQLLAPPNAPANLKATQSAPEYRPATSQVADPSEPVVLAWTHASVDTTPQSAYSLRWRLTGATAWTTVAKTASVTSSRTFPAGTWEPGAVVEWQVQTWGGHADASPWSATSTFTAAARPTVAISAPGEEIDTSRATASWAYYQEAGRPQSQWALTLTRDGQQVEVRSGSGATDSLALTSTLADGVTYALTVEVLSADGLWSAPDTRAFTVTYASPPAAVVAGVFDPEQGAMVLSIDTPAPDEGEPPAVSVDLYRRINGAEWEQIATNLPPTTTILDHTCITHGLNEYRADSVSALPSTREGEAVGIEVDATAAYLSGGAGFSTVGRVLRNVELTSSVGRAEQGTEYYAGRIWPVEMAGEAMAETIKLTWSCFPASLVDDPDPDVRWWQALTRLPAPFLWRDVEGRHMYCSLAPIQATRGPAGTYTLTTTLERIDADEIVRPEPLES